LLPRHVLAVSLGLCAGSAATAQRARSARPQSGIVAPRHLYELRTSPVNDGACATGDLDGDGDLDLLMLQHDSHAWVAPTAVQVWLNGGRGDFHQVGVQPLEGWADGSGFSIATYVRLADVTGDGRLDLAYERSGVGTTPPAVSVHPGQGDGSFAAALTLVTQDPVHGLELGDCDADGDADLLVLQAVGTSRSAAWWRLESGGFVAGPVLTDTLLRVVLVDLDADGVQDVAATTPDTVRIYRTVNGACTLHAAVPLPSTLHFRSPRLHTGDLDGDGDEDVLAVHHDFDSDTFHFQPFRNDGTGFIALPLQGFAQQGGYDAILAHNDGALADWDGDGDADYVSPSIAWMENTGAGEFVLAAHQRSGASPNGGYRALQVVDLDGDGHLDVLADWMHFRGDGTFPARTSIGESVFNWTATTTWSVLEDREGDGDLDLVGRTWVHLNRGDATFEERALPNPSVPGVFGPPTEIAWADFDGDGFRDKVIAFAFGSTFERMALYTGTEAGPHVLSDIYPSPNRMTVDDVSLPADFDSDGDLDILMRDGYWRNDGTGWFGFGKVSGYVGLPRLARDYDGDGDVDVLLGRAGTLILLVSDAGEAFVEVPLGGHQNNHRHAFVDADQDGDLDLAVVKPSNSALFLHEQLSGGGLAAPLELAAPAVEDPVAQMDVDGDGRLDLVAAQANGTRLVAWLRADGLEFRPRREWTVSQPPIGFGDLDRDGDVDFAGRFIFENFRFDGPADGAAVQYGLDAATSGTGGRHPVLGSGGPVRPGMQVKLVISGGRGGASGVLLRGPARADSPGASFHELVASAEVVRSFVLGGTPGAAGEGSIVLQTPIVAAVVGLTFDYQAVLVDPGAVSGLSATNGLEIRYGDWPPSR
jgi:hypothetical protein